MKYSEKNNNSEKERIQRFTERLKKRNKLLNNDERTYWKNLLVSHISRIICYLCNLHNTSQVINEII